MKTPLYKKYGFWITIVALLLIILVGVELVAELSQNRIENELTMEQCQEIVNSTFENLPVSDRGASGYILGRTKITVSHIEYGYEKDIKLTCNYETIDTKNALQAKLPEIISQAYSYTLEKPHASGTDIELKVTRKLFMELLESATPVSGTVTLYIYETTGGMSLYLSDEAVDTCTGGIISVLNMIDNTNTVEHNGNTVDITKNGSLRTGVKNPLALQNYSSAKPFTGGPIIEAIQDFRTDFYTNFIEGNRYMHLVRGLGVTLLLTLLAALFGIFLGFIIAIIRCTNLMTGALKLPDAICRLYLTVMRGTPVMVQLLIMHFVILAPFKLPPFVSAVICFGINSGAYVAEIVRGGIMSIDKGQIEAGRSLGFNYVQTMVHFVVPQAFKAILPSLANEFISLLKESSVAFAIGLGDLTFGGNLIRSVTYSPFLPLLAVALIYLVLVMILSKLVSILERRLAKSDR